MQNPRFKTKNDIAAILAMVGMFVLLVVNKNINAIRRKNEITRSNDITALNILIVFLFRVFFY
ncbi:MAG: hypothetical protein DHS20C13_03540 [Thermodesulfobacteriota bacterium]|nr:MAG: hypothetical protein DHS20C13_03540 [Thermodesulfobacteriota bacterium]